MKKNVKILIVDDEPQQLETIVRSFEEFEEEYIIYRAFNGNTALKIVEKELPNLVITDWDMPGIDGIELIRAIKKNPSTKDIPIIMCSGVMISSENLNTALEAGAVDYIRKPLDPIELIARTRSMLKLSDSIAEVKALNAEKDKFFGVVAHDLRNPFQSLLGFSKMLVKHYDKYDDEKRQHFIEILSHSAQSAYDFLENLLIWSRTQRGKLPFRPNQFFIIKIVNAVVGSLEKMIGEKEVKIHIDCPPEHTIFGDRDMLSNVIRNVLSNAIKYSHSKGKIILKSKKQEDKLTFTVQDFGVGIEAKNLDKLFRIDINYSTPGTNKERGTGLGLIISQELLRLNQGSIEVESHPDKGSVFTVQLPASKTEP